jgi:hypothetical protein
MKVEWVLIADGAAQDSRGAVTAVALNQNVLSAPTLPVPAKRAVIAHVAEAPGILKPGDKFEVTFQVTAPSGDVISVQKAQIAVGQLQWPDLPVSTDLPVELLLNLSEYGSHHIEVKVRTAGGDQSEGSVDLFVVPPPGDSVQVAQPGPGS